MRGRENFEIQQKLKEMQHKVKKIGDKYKRDYSFSS